MANQDDKKPGAKGTPNAGAKTDRSAPKRKPVTIEGKAEATGTPKTTSSPNSGPKADAKPAAKPGTSVPPTKAATAPAKDVKADGKQNANLGRAGADAKTESVSTAPKAADKNSESKKPDDKKSGGLGAGLIGGLAGGALVALLAGGWSLVAGNGGTANLDELRAQNAALVERLAQVEATQADMGDADPSAELIERVNALSAQVQALPAQAGEALDLTPVTDRLAELESGLQQAQSSAQSAVQTASALQSQVEGGGSGDAPALAAQSARLDELSDTVSILSGQLDEMAGAATNAADLSEPVDLSPVTSQIESLSAELAEAKASMQAMAETISGNSSGVESVQTRLSGLADMVASLSSAMDDAQASLASRGDEQQVARAALAAATLAATIDGGKPFVAELDNFAAVTAGSDALAGGAQSAEVLRPFADAGVPTVATLQGEWPAVAQSILDAVRPAPEGVGDKFVSNLRGLVSVRPAGDVGGDGPRAVVGRMTAALDEAQLERFQSLQAELPEAGQAASADFARRVAARNEANSLLTSVLSGGADDTSSEGTAQ